MKKNPYRNRHESALRYFWRVNRWPLLVMLIILLILGIVGHIEFNDLQQLNGNF